MRLADRGYVPLHNASRSGWAGMCGREVDHSIAVGDSVDWRVDCRVDWRVDWRNGRTGRASRFSRETRLSRVRLDVEQKRVRG
jgi:hypothetical protein